MDGMLQPPRRHRGGSPGVPKEQDGGVPEAVGYCQGLGGVLVGCEDWDEGAEWVGDVEVV